MSTGIIQDQATGIPVRTLKLLVLEGPDSGREIIADSETLSVGTAPGNDLVLQDTTVSRYHLELSQRHDGVLVVDHGSTNGTYVGPVRIQIALVRAGTALRVGRSTVQVLDGSTRTISLYAGEAMAGLVGSTPVMRRLMARIEQAARSESAVLVVGESGTGKELVARALHDLGPRARGPFVTVDCGALAPTLVASEIFGHERGAFTGADRQHIGAFEQANGGTLFLDEIGELPAQLQSTLLGVLERRRFRRLGGKAPISVDVRIVSATNRDLRAEVNAGGFRLDLYYRLAVVVFQVPPLRERVDDIPLLVEHFLRDCGFAGSAETLIPPDALRSLSSHHWPGNVRELRNLVEATLAMGEAPKLESELEGAETTASGQDVIGALLARPYRDARSRLLFEFESRYLRHILDRAGGNVSRAAREARLDRSHLRTLLKRHGLL